MKTTALSHTREKYSSPPWRRLDQVRHSLDMSAVNRAVDLLTQAKKIAFFGLGSSAAVAHDAMNKFFPL